MKIFMLMVVILLVSLPTSAQEDENNRIRNAGKVMVEILNVPDDIPKDLLDKAECVIVLPSVMKFAIGFGGSYGRGVMTCRSARDFSGRWSAPAMMALEGGSFGLQLGGQATDFVLLVMNQRGANSILTSQVKLGGDMAATAGPKGRSAAASTDVTLRAEILSYSRSRGLFAGISLERQLAASGIQSGYQGRSPWLVRVGTYSFRHCGAGSSGRAGSRSYGRRRPHGEPPM